MASTALRRSPLARRFRASSAAVKIVSRSISVGVKFIIASSPESPTRCSRGEEAGGVGFVGRHGDVGGGGEGARSAGRRLREKSGGGEARAAQDGLGIDVGDRAETHRRADQRDGRQVGGDGGRALLVETGAPPRETLDDGHV